MLSFPNEQQKVHLHKFKDKYVEWQVDRYSFQYFYKGKYDFITSKKIHKVPNNGKRSKIMARV